MLARCFKVCLFLSLFTVLSCSRSGKNDSTLKFQLPSSSQKAAQESMSGPLNQWGLTDIAELDDINCYAVLVARSNPSEAKNTCLDATNNLSFPVSQVAGLYPAGSQVELVVNSGPAQTIYLLGLKTTASCKVLLNENLNLSQFSRPKVIAKKVVSIDPGLNVVRMSASLIGSFNVKSCRGPDLAFGEPETAFPTVSISSPAADSFVNASNVTAFHVSGSCSAEGDVSLDFNSGLVQENTSCVSGTWSASVDLSSLIDGNVQLSVEHMDTAGNSAIPVSRTFIKDTVAPTLAFTSPAVNTVVNTTMTSFNVAGTCSENGRPIQISGGASIVTATCASGAWTANLDFSNKTPGTLTVTATSSDAAGNEASTSRNFIKNTPAVLALTTGSTLVQFSNTIANGGTSSLTFTLKNNGQMQANSISIPAPTGSFSMTTNTCSSGTLAAGGTCDVTLSFTPQAYGMITQNLTITYNDSGSSQTLLLQLQGNGVNPAQLIIKDGGIQITSYDFGFTELDEDSTKTLTLVNMGNYDASNIQFGTLPNGFSAAPGGCTGTIQTGNSCSFTVTFHPTDQNLQSTTLPINFNDGLTTASVLLNLSGTGAENKITLSNLTISHRSKTGFDVSVGFTGDGNNNAQVKAYYCNKTSNSACDPETGGDNVVLTKDGAFFKGHVSLSPSNAFNEIKVRIVAADTDGVAGSIADQTAILANAFLQVTAGQEHTCGVTVDHEIKCWGYNADGELGNGTTTNSLSAVAIAVSKTWMFVESSRYSTCAIDDGGNGYCWGEGSNGQLGNGSTADKSTPTLVSGSHAWSKITPGILHTCGLTTTGEVYCWGSGSNGRLGNGSGSDQSTPSKISGARTYTDVTVGQESSCALAADKTIYCWGSNSDGQLGNGGGSDQNTPTAIPSISFDRLSLSYKHACGTENGTGKLYCWGTNGNGELGHGDSGNYYNGPVLSSSGSTGWAALDMGDNHSCGLRGSDLYCWGANSYGQVGNNSASDQLTSVLIKPNQLAVSAGSLHTCSIDSDHTLWCWGNNYSGQLGDNSTTDRSAPVHVSP